MNKLEVLFSVSEKSGMCMVDCERVIDAFERVLMDDLSQKRTGGIVDKLIKLLNYMKKLHEK